MIHAEERGTPNTKKKIDWKSTTDRPVGSRAAAIGKLEWYDFEMEEVFHKILNRAKKLRRRSSGPRSV